MANTITFGNTIGNEPAIQLISLVILPVIQFKIVLPSLLIYFV